MRSVEEAAGKARAATDKIGEGGNPFGFMTKGVDELVPKLLETVSIVALVEKGFEALHEAVDWVKESIGHADFIRDLELSLVAYTGSVQNATQVTAYFREEQVKTRNTAEELQQSFRNLNPLETTKGFTLGAQEQITVMLSQVATVANKSLDTIESGFRRILATGGSGGGAGRNPLLQVLGISGDQLKNMGWDEFLSKLQTAAAKSEEFGQSWESTMHKASDALKNAFAEGFNEARGSAVEGMDAITTLVKDPAVVTWLHDAGVMTAEWIAKLAGVATEIKGIIALGHQAESQRSSDYAIATLGVSKLWTYVVSGVAAAGQERAKADAQNASNQAGANVIREAGLSRPSTDFEGLAAKGSHEKATIDVSGVGGLPNLQKAVGDLIAQDGMNAEQQKVFIQNLRDAAADAKAEHRAFSLSDVMGAGADTMAEATGKIEGAPGGRMAGGATSESATDAAKIKTKQLLEQSGILDLQNQKLGIQAQLDQETQALGEKKTGLENVALDAVTRQILAQHEINALRVVDLDTAIGATKALNDYQTTLDEIDKKQAANAAKKGGGENVDWNAERAAAFVKYGSAIDEVAAKDQKGIVDAIDGTKKLTLAQQALVQARNDEVLKLQSSVAIQRDQNDVLTAQIAKATLIGQLSAVELTLTNQKAVFGGMALDQQAQSLLKQHDAIALQQVANDTEIAMQEERKRYEKERQDNAKTLASIYLNAATRDPITGTPTDPASVAALAALEQLAAQQAQGDALKLNSIQQTGADNMLAAAQKNRDYQTQTVAILLKGYADIATLMGSVVDDAVTGLVKGNFSGAFKGLADEFQHQIATTIGDSLKTIITKLQKTAQGTAQWDPNAISADGEGFGNMVTPSHGQQQTAQTAMATVQGAMALYSIISSGSGMTKGQGAMSGAVTGAVTGAELFPANPVVGAVIGAIVGAIAGYMSGGSGKPSYTVSVAGGQISVTGGGSAHQSDVDAAIGQINAQIQAGTTAVHGLFDAFPVAIGQSLNTMGLADIFKFGPDTVMRWFDATTLKTFESQDLPAEMLKAYTPIIEGGLKALGVTQEKIKSLFSGQATADPTAFFKFVTDYVTGFVAMQNTIAFLGKTSTEKTGVAATLASPALTDQLSKANENIAYLGQGFDKLTNTDQVARLTQINAAIAQRYQLEMTALQDIANARKAVKDSYAQTETGFRMSGETAQQQIADLQRQAGVIAGQLFGGVNRFTRQTIEGAKTPAEVTALANSYQQLETSIYNAAKSLRDSFQTILDSFAALDKQKAADIIAALDPTAQLNAITTSASGISVRFGGMSQADQITNSQTLIGLATQYYNVQKQALTDLGNAAKSIHESIAKQIFSINYDQLKNDPQAQIEALNKKDRELYASINSATTAQQVNDIVSQIQGNVTTISQLEGNTPQAAADAINALNAADKAAQDQIKVLTAQATANDDAIAASIKNVGDSVTATIGTLNTLMTTATTNLIAFSTLVQQKLDTFVTDLTTSDAALLLTLQPIFAALGTAADEVGDDFTPVHAGLIDFTGGLADATAALRRFSSNGSFSNPNFSAASVTTTNVIQFSPNLSINVSGSMAPLVDMMSAVFDQKMATFQTQSARFTKTRAM